MSDPRISGIWTRQSRQNGWIMVWWHSMQAHDPNLCHSCGFLCGQALRASLSFFLYPYPSLPLPFVTSHEFSHAACFPGPFWEWIGDRRCSLWSCFPSITSPFGQHSMPASAARSCSCPGLGCELCWMALGWMDGALQAALSIPFLRQNDKIKPN